MICGFLDFQELATLQGAVCKAVVAAANGDITETADEVDAEAISTPTGGQIFPPGHTMLALALEDGKDDAVEGVTGKLVLAEKYVEPAEDGYDDVKEGTNGMLVLAGVGIVAGGNGEADPKEGDPGLLILAMEDGNDDVKKRYQW